MQIVRATVEDAAPILALQRLAYQSEAQLYDDYAIPPLLQTLEQLQQETVAKVVLKALQGARIVGSVRASVQGGTCQIERLIVHPELQGRGIGTRLMHEVEACFTGPRVTSCSRATAARAACSSTPGWGTAPSASSSSATA